MWKFLKNFYVALIKEEIYYLEMGFLLKNAMAVNGWLIGQII